MIIGTHPKWTHFALCPPNIHLFSQWLVHLQSKASKLSCLFSFPHIPRAIYQKSVSSNSAICLRSDHVSPLPTPSPSSRPCHHHPVMLLHRPGTDTFSPPLPITHPAPAMLASSLLYLKHAKTTPTPGPLLSLFPLHGIPSRIHP